MDEITKNEIIRYIGMNYILTHEGIVDFYATCTSTGVKVNISVIYEELISMFGLSTRELTKYFNAWVDHETIRIDNENVDDAYMKYTSGIPFVKKETLSTNVATITKIRCIHDYNVKMGIF